ncbi:hypothetical protein [Bordetella phage vB_BbrM_PHB04]|uniref:Uncharacterized protein n=1 Tax=Bordetella phage vB_BbrM_PHB04 TaxID=2029657 RepID=A0A291LAU4_9CAUD|nr:hypothetical protein HOS14_gp110 [Bordetella phage vB_BbrM_PHB04]ATI15728.1 hypothetical protein [Bordetella phage vB_BbrM_PHB04]
MNTAKIKAALRARFCAPEWAIMFEVGDGTGTNQRRWADAVAMNLWPSRGLEIHGFEIKASRSDWLRELKNPAKAESVQRYCDRWWIVAPPGVVKDGELPPTWGLYEAKDGKLRQAVAAPQLAPQPVDRSFIAAMLRRAGAVDADEVRAAVDAEVAAARAGDEKRIEQEIESRTRRHADLAKAVQEIESISGVKISAWGDSKEIGRAVKLVLDSGALQTYGGIHGMRNQIAATLKDFDKALGAFPPPAEDAA